MNEVYYNSVSLDKLYEGYLKYGVGKKCLIFNSSNKVNKLVYDHFKSHGINAKMFDTSKHKEIILRRVKSLLEKKLLNGLEMSVTLFLLTLMYSLLVLMWIGCGVCIY